MENKDLGGRPPIFNTPEELRLKINEYFEYVKGEFEEVLEINEEGIKETVKKWIRYPENVTITGLCIYLGFDSRQSFYDYEKRDGFSYIIKKARLLVENSYEDKAIDAKNPTFHIFALKNMGWSDKHEIDHTSGGEKIEPTRIVFGSNGNKKEGD